MGIIQKLPARMQLQNLRALLPAVFVVPNCHFSILKSFPPVCWLQIPHHHLQVLAAHPRASSSDSQVLFFQTNNKTRRVQLRPQRNFPATSDLPLWSGVWFSQERQSHNLR